jgi:hypothetical protein
VRKRHRRQASSALLAEADGSLLELVDHVLTKGVVVTGDVVLGLADIDLVYLRLSVLLCSADRVLEPAPGRRGMSRRRRLPALR